MSKIVVVYYSHSGNTRGLAKLIASKTNADCLEIIPQNEYPNDYNSVVAQAKQEISRNYRPAIKNIVDISAYDTVIIGTPNWWSTMAPPVATFIEEHDLSGKTVIPFCTHGGGGFGHIETDVKNMASKANAKAVLSGLAVYDRDYSDNKINKWLAQNHIL